jgi:hypothetical protein
MPVRGLAVARTAGRIVVQPLHHQPFDQLQACQWARSDSAAIRRLGI